MSEEYRSGQGTIVPTMFIGMGGTGSRIVDRIAERAALLPNWQSQLAPLTQFVAVDTNELDQHRLRSIPEGNRLNIAAVNKAGVIEGFRRSHQEQALQWLDRGYQPRPGFTPGAGQIRVESRLGFFYHSPEIRQRLIQLVKDTLAPGITWRQDNPRKYYVYLFCTLAGGTGSGSFLSMAYLVQQVIGQHQGWQPRVIGNLLLSTLMLDLVGPELHPDIHANTYAALKEVEHLTKLDYSEVKKEGRTAEPFACWWDQTAPGVPEVRSRPFFLAFVHDRPPHLGLPDATAAIADAAYLQVFTPIIDQLAGELDNYEKHLEGLTRFPGELKGVGLGYTKNFGVFGAAALVLPAHDLLEYAAHRFAAQALRSQITFGLDRERPDDERTRALAKLAVDYNDPKFLKMSDEGRERAINDSFVASVRELARQDERDELPDGFWRRLVDRIDLGEITGHNDAGEAQRGEPLVAGCRRLLAAGREEVVTKNPVKTVSFVFHREGVNQYVELVSRLKERIFEARTRIGEAARSLELAASEGEVITDQKLDPIAERYLVLRVLEECATRWLPEAVKEREEAERADLSNAKVRERLEREIFDSLRDAAAARKLFRKNDQAFLDARDEAQVENAKAAAAAEKFHRADLQLRQLRQLETYLRSRARQYARLANHMNGLVAELEQGAERLRRAEIAIARGMALRVEVFETLDEPRRRLWDEVYRALFIDEGRYVVTFDRQILAETISRELRPEARADGRVVQKAVEKLVADLRKALLELGRRRLKPAIFGGDGQSGLDLQQGLELEARLVLAPGSREPQRTELEAYAEKKMRALAQLAGVLARIDAADSRALDDGVVVNRTRQLVVGPGGGGSQASERFLEQLRGVLGLGGYQVKETAWHDPRIAIVHDVALPIPLYYIRPVVGELEDAYLRLAADEKRAYHLHTAYTWEKSLPNLNPRRAEVAVDWSLRLLASALAAGVVAYSGSGWQWRLQPQGEARELGASLSGALYRIGEIHRNDDLRRRFEERLEEARGELGELELQRRRVKLEHFIDQQLGRMGLREIDGEITARDTLDRPIWRALLALLRGGGALAARRPAAEASGYEEWSFEDPAREPVA